MRGGKTADFVRRESAVQTEKQGPTLAQIDDIPRTEVTSALRQLQGSAPNVHGLARINPCIRLIGNLTKLLYLVPKTPMIMHY